MGAGVSFDEGVDPVAATGLHLAPQARGRAEEVARTSYGRLVAILAARTGDIELAEDCLGDAFTRALRRWPEAGIPSNPEGWLLTVARNRQRDVLASPARRSARPLSEAPPATASVALAELDSDAIPDHRLALLFVCAHPATDGRIRAPLMLQTVLGFEARHIAEAFAIPPAAMAQRLVRAKRRIRDAHIPFAVPGRDHLPARLEPVLEAVYGAYAIDWRLVAGTSPRGSLAGEARYLAATIAQLLGDEPEAWGLAALISLSMARTGARGSGDEFVPLGQQDPALWDTSLIGEGEALLQRASTFDRIGRFQLEAAIQSVHCARRRTGQTDWNALQRLYTALVSVAPTLGAEVAAASVTARVRGAAAGLAALDRITDPAVARFQPAWAHLLAEAGRRDDAARAFARAISLTTDPGSRGYLERQLAALSSQAPCGDSR